jgi:uncharacterized membrane protein
MFEYLYKAATVWFIGFFPFFELFVAIPVGMSLRLDPVSTVLFCVAGNFFPILLIEYGYSRLMTHERIRNWFNRRISVKMCRNINQYGIWYMLVITPWVGVWAMAVTVKILRMKKTTLFAGAFISLLVYSIALVIIIQAGIDFAAN